MFGNGFGRVMDPAVDALHPVGVPVEASNEFRIQPRNVWDVVLASSSVYLISAGL